MIKTKGGKVHYGAGGSYAASGNRYEETPEYGIGNVESIQGTTHKFECRVEGKKWRHTGSLADGLTIEEVWERGEKNVR